MLISDAELKNLLIKTGLTNEEKFNQVVEYAKASGGTVADALIERDVITDENLGILIADYFKIPFIVLSKTGIPEEVYHIVPERLARRQKVIAFAKSPDGIKLAMADPRNTLLQELLTRKTGLRIIPYFATERDIYN